MTPQEAIKELKRMQLKTNSIESNVAITVGISALEKRIPKKPIARRVNKEYDIDTFYICPCCHCVLADTESDRLSENS